MVPDRALARRQLEFRRLGTVLRRTSDLGKVPDWKIYRKSPDLGTASLCHDYRHDRLGFLQQYRSFSSLRIPEGLVLHGRRTFCQHLYALFAENEFDSACYRMPDVYAGADEAVQYFVQKECSDRYYNDFVSTGFGYSLSDFQQLQPIPVL